MMASLPVGRRLALSVAALAAGITVILLLSVPGALGAYTARVTNSANAVTTSQYFSCTGASTGFGAALAWPLDDAGVINVVGTARDVSGNSRTGNTTIGGITYRQTGSSCPRDLVNAQSYSMLLNGSSGFLTSAAALTVSNTFTESIWFKTSTTQGGRLVGFGDGTTGASTRQSDRHIYMTTGGALVFGVYAGAVKTITTPLAYNDNTWHQVVASLGSNGMQLYVDGKPVVADLTTTTAQTYTPSNTGYFRVGYDNLGGWTTPPASNYFGGSVRFAAYFASTLTATQIATLYAAGTGS